MTTDMEKLREKMKGMGGGSGGGGSRGDDIVWFKPPEPSKSTGDGQEVVIRILPQGDNNGGLFLSHVLKHYNISDRGFTCPQTHGADCVVCEASWEFYHANKNSENTKAVREACHQVWKKSKNKDIHYASVLDRADRGSVLKRNPETNEPIEWEYPDGAPKVWSFSRAVKEQLFTIMFNGPAPVDITDVDAGYDVYIRKDNKDGNNIPKITLSVPVGSKPTPAFAHGEPCDWFKVDKLVGKVKDDLYQQGIAWLTEEGSKIFTSGTFDNGDSEPTVPDRTAAPIVITAPVPAPVPVQAVPEAPAGGAKDPRVMSFLDGLKAKAASSS